jgi:hypothetical protein
MECPYCGSVNSLVWDMSRGVVVCSECGTVLDLIYVSYGNPEYEHENPKSMNVHTFKKTKKLTEASLKYLEILKEIKYNPMLFIDSYSFSRYLVLGKRVKVVKRRAELPKNEVLEAIVSLMSKYPKLCSRTDRAKYAIATIAYTLVTEGGIDPSKLSKELGISKTHVRRLMRVVSESRRFLSEVRRLLPASLTTPIPR